MIIRFPKLGRVDTRRLSELLEAAETLEGRGLPEILFIKRAVSKRDRWSNHIALPGGRRDPHDASDVDTAIREAREEVGLDLKQDAIYVGPLDQRLVKVSWATKAIMTLCSHVFVLTEANAKLTLQTSEVADAFWHPVKQLFDSHYWDQEYVHLEKRLGLENSYIPRFLHPLINKCVGNMYFRAINLWRFDATAGTPPERLWGLTLGIVVDFLEVCQPGSVVALVQPPHMAHVDINFVTKLLSFRQTQKSKKLLHELRNRGSYTAGSLDLVQRLINGHFSYLFPSILVTMALRMLGVLLLIRYLRSKR